MTQEQKPAEEIWLSVCSRCAVVQRQDLGAADAAAARLRGRLNERQSVRSTGAHTSMLHEEE
jgi:hypothetical protein